MRAARFLLVRHGETASNREDRFRGRLDVPLNDSGRRQAEAAGRALAGEPVRAVYSSPLSRALDTAKALALPHGLEPVPYEPILDFHFGDWQGKLRPEARSAWPEHYRLYERDPARFRAPGGESLAELFLRVREGLLALAARHGGETIALASHAVVCKAALLVAQGFGLERYWDVKAGNCSISEFSHGPGGWILARADDRRHLEK